MEFTIEFGGTPQDVTLTTSGVANPAGLRRLSAALKSDPRYRPGLLILADYTELDMSELSARDIEEIATESVARHWDSRPRALALVTSSLPNFVRAREGVAHMGGSLDHRRAFTTREAAIDWLHQQRLGEHAARPGI